MGDSTFNEEYIGKLPELVAVSRDFTTILRECRKKPKSCNPNKLQENKNIQKTLKKLFGLKAMHIYWIPYNVANAYTVFDTALLADEHAKGMLERIPGKGFYDTDHAMVYVVFIYTGILLKKYDLTGDEMTAVILHELGHNCDDLPFTRISVFKRIYLKMTKKTSIEWNNEQKLDTYNKTKKKWDEVYNNKEKREEVDKYCDRLYGNINTNPLILAFLNLLFFGVSHKLILWSPIFQLISLNDRKMEQFADSMPAAYGYGAEQMSALRKMMGETQNTDMGAITSILSDIYRAQFEMSIIILDPHSSNQARCKDLIVKLRNDLRRGDYTPELKEDLLNEIRELEEEYDILLNVDSDKRISVLRGFRKIMDKLFGGRPEWSRLFGQNQM